MNSQFLRFIASSFYRIVIHFGIYTYDGAFCVGNSPTHCNHLCKRIPL